MHDANNSLNGLEEVVIEDAADSFQTARSVGGQREVESALSDRFTIVEPIGTSDNVGLYLARPAGGDLVQLRVLSETLAGDAKDVELFYREARAAAQLSHENILRTSNPEQVSGLHFCTVEHRPVATTLSSLLSRGGWLEFADAVRITIQLLSALAHAHERGVLHLKLHTRRVLLEPSGRVLLSGFGIEAHDDLAWAHRRRTLQCAPQYQSPEQLAGALVDHRSDLYSLGVLLYEMLTDRVPYDSRNLGAIKRKLTTQSPLPPRTVAGDVPAVLSQLVLGLLEKAPDRRFQSSAGFRDALTGALCHSHDHSSL